jgi:hypothetical protein
VTVPVYIMKHWHGISLRGIEGTHLSALVNDMSEQYRGLPGVSEGIVDLKNACNDEGGRNCRQREQ